ncbi:hypothetical protein FA13DRAFT_175113 [Coprinellus micaceus]|uniref:Uncharacterized protein n=1 Tax=Coprinellus micaceus TaxID=71717 RepID=A0A4Y7SH20_COPMI|nr:hypothetical protein FA13DRAFT_175113 [Coprinellus micaceus]
MLAPGYAHHQASFSIDRSDANAGLSSPSPSFPTGPSWGPSGSEDALNVSSLSLSLSVSLSLSLCPTTLRVLPPNRPSSPQRTWKTPGLPARRSTRCSSTLCSANRVLHRDHFGSAARLPSSCARRRGSRHSSQSPPRSDCHDHDRYVRSTTLHAVFTGHAHRPPPRSQWAGYSFEVLLVQGPPVVFACRSLSWCTASTSLPSPSNQVQSVSASTSPPTLAPHWGRSIPHRTST